MLPSYLRNFRDDAEIHEFIVSGDTRFTPHLKPRGYERAVIEITPIRDHRTAKMCKMADFFVNDSI